MEDIFTVAKASEYCGVSPKTIINWVESGYIEAYKTVGFNVPLVVRLEGTEVDEGRRLIAESDVDIVAASDLTDAAKKVVAALGSS